LRKFSWKENRDTFPATRIWNVQHATLQLILDYIWMPIVTAIVLLWQRVTGQSSRIALLEQARQFSETMRLENRKLRDAQREEITQRIDNYHTTVMGKLDSMEVRIKNGHK